MTPKPTPDKKAIEIMVKHCANDSLLPIAMGNAILAAMQEYADLQSTELSERIAAYEANFADVRNFLLRHPDQEMVRDACNHIVNPNDQWIPIIGGDLSGLPDGNIWFTIKKPGGGIEVNYITGKWIKEQVEKFGDGFTVLLTAWMPYNEPKPYQP